MKKYRKKPIEVYAMQWEGRDIRQIGDLLSLSCGNGYIRLNGHNQIEIDTLEGTMKAQAGDYIVCGIKGELYPVKKNIFEESYEEVQVDG